MTNASEREHWALGSADLPARCRQVALEASTLLRGAVFQESEVLLGEGFVVPSGESLLHASEVFASIAALPGGEFWLQRPDPQASMHVICAVSGTMQGFEAEWDLSALSSWWAWRDAQTVLEQANGARTLVNSGQLEQALALLRADIERAEREYGATR